MQFVWITKASKSTPSTTYTSKCMPHKSYHFKQHRTTPSMRDTKVKYPQYAHLSHAFHCFKQCKLANRRQIKSACANAKKTGLAESKNDAKHTT